MLTHDQIEGSRFLASRRVAYLADVPGLGKTAQYVRAIDAVGASAAIIVCPPILRSKLRAEIDLWSLVGHTVHVIQEGSDDVPADGLCVVSYALATQPAMLAKLCARNPGPVIFDEAHALKEPKAKRTQECLGTLVRYATHVWFISGTPAPNNASELFPFIRLAGLWPKSYDAYVREFCTTKPDRYDKRGYRVIGSRNIPQLQGLIAGHLLRRTKVEGRPPLSVDTIAIPGADTYAALAPEYLVDIVGAMAMDDWSFADLDSVSTVRRLAGVAKVAGTIQLARQEIENGHSRLLIFGTHVAALTQIAEALRPVGAALVNGSTSARDADRLITEFQTHNSEPRILVANMQTMGEAVTLTACSRILVFEPSWTPKDNEQVIARAWRRGQLNPVHVSFISLAGSIDDAITRIVARKTKEISALLK